jgi:DNA polymerase-3 subunit delta'
VSRGEVFEEELPSRALFDAVVGQERAVAALRAAARRPVHAYLFVGRPGSGSRAAARGFAAALVCPQGGCGACDACRRALVGTHPDVVTVERTGADVDVDDARLLGRLALRRPLVAERQVLVMADVHLAERAAPALLKTLEEPPPTTVFVLLADDVPPDLATVASRCAELLFPPVPVRAVAGWLVGRGADPAHAQLVAEGAGGDVERARLLLEDPGFADRLALWRSVPSRLDGHGAVAGALVRELLAATDRALAPLRREHEAQLAALEEDAKVSGERGVPGRKEVLERQHREERRWRTDELRTGLGVLARAYSERLAAAVAPERAGGGDTSGTVASAATGGIGSEGRAWVSRPGAARACESAVALVTEAANGLRRNAQETLLLEALFVRLAQLDA